MYIQCMYVICMHVRMSVYMYVCICRCMYVYNIYVYIRMKYVSELCMNSVHVFMCIHAM